MSEASNETAAPEPREKFIPLRKSDIVAALVSDTGLPADQALSFRRFARMLGAIFHVRYFEELDQLREAYFYFDPEVSAPATRAAGDVEAAYRNLSDEFVRVVTEANFVEIPHEVIVRAFGEHALVRVRIEAPIEEFRDVRMFRRGDHKETIEIPSLFGLRRRSLEVEVYDDVVLMVATKVDGERPKPRKPFASAWRGTKGKRKKLRGGAVLFKYFRHIARGDLEALFPDVRVVMSVFDQLALGVPALVGGVPILIKLASTLTVLFAVAGFYLGLSGALHDDDTKQALAAISGLFALGAFVLRQWGNFHRQSLIHQKQVTDNIYFRNVNNNTGIFNYLIGEAEEQDWKEALLAYYGLLTAAAPLSADALGARVEALLMEMFGVRVAFAHDDALKKLRELDLLREADGPFAVPPLAEALAGLETQWDRLLRGKDQP
ncbi:TMEM143 family protein [Bradyrhizobium sp.]|uniref:TMEM143 family protein n=1 Tax=Bradyrhizobium sp. TaxID=376 RepID=UPI001D228E82|nr:TMEM143 family protein [Bradyrhizobium sp.]MBV8701517.1 DUF3754 domain-containing protein [Bradyrhizobium sp.]MBV8917755.1 DUF3754 domain-containing protein [Bradyrhizobium sp.]